MNMKIFSVVYCLVALAVAMTTTFMQVQPALFFIDLITDSDNMFDVKLALLLTMLALLLPLLIILLVLKMMNKNKNHMPDTFGKTGIIVRRGKALSNALYDSVILVNGEPKSSVSNGKSTFIELPAGMYTLQVKGYSSTETQAGVQHGRITEYALAFVDDGGLKVKVMLEPFEAPATVA
jgi:hypothetical protein